MFRIYTCSQVPGPYGLTNVLGPAEGEIDLDTLNASVVITFRPPYQNMGKLVIPESNIAAIQCLDEAPAVSVPSPQPPDGEGEGDGGGSDAPADVPVPPSDETKPETPSAKRSRR